MRTITAYKLNTDDDSGSSRYPHPWTPNAQVFFPTKEKALEAAKQLLEAVPDNYFDQDTVRVIDRQVTCVGNDTIVLKGRKETRERVQRTVTIQGPDGQQYSRRETYYEEWKPLKADTNYYGTKPAQEGRFTLGIVYAVPVTLTFTDDLSAYTVKEGDVPLQRPSY